MSTLATDLVKKWEGLRFEAYRDVAGVWTIGYGHTGPDAFPSNKITEDEAEALLRNDMEWARRSVDESVDVSISPEQRAALISLAYNIGAPAFKQSTALRRLNNGDYAGAAEAITWFNKVTKGGEKVISNGLVNRREDERRLFMQGLRTQGSDVTGGDVTGGEHKTPTESKTIIGALGGLGGLIPAAIQAFSSLDWRVAIPLIVVGGILAYIAFNRWLEMRRGVH